MAWDRFTHPRNPKFGAPTQLQVRMQNDAPRPCASAQIMNPQPRPQTTQSAKKSTIHEREEVFFTQFGIFNFLLGIFNFRSSRCRENAMDWDQLVATQVVDLRFHPNLCPKSKIARVLHANASIFRSGVDFSRFQSISVDFGWFWLTSAAPSWFQLVSADFS